MKKTTLALLIVALLLTSCDKWQQDISYLTPEEIQEEEEKLDAALQTLKSNPKDVEVNFEVGYRYEHLGQLKHAETYYLKALELDPNQFVAVNNLASVYEDAKKYDKAAEMGEKLFNLQPNNTGVLKKVVHLFLQNDDPEDATLALEYFSRANKDTMTAEDLTFVSDLYQSIVDYKAEQER